MKTWSADELAAFLAFAAQDRELALYHVAAATGMRRGELLNRNSSHFVRSVSSASVSMMRSENIPFGQLTLDRPADAMMIVNAH